MFLSLLSRIPSVAQCTILFPAGRMAPAPNQSRGGCAYLEEGERRLWCEAGTIWRSLHFGSRSPCPPTSTRPSSQDLNHMWSRGNESMNKVQGAVHPKWDEYNEERKKVYSMDNAGAL